MEKGVRLFENKEFGKVRTLIGKDGSALFCARDVCSILGYGNSSDAIARHVNPADTAKHKPSTEVKVQTMLYVNESGLYSLILRSNMPKARAFQHWVTREVLPDLRRFGAYLTEPVKEQVMEDPNYLRRMAQQMALEKAKCKALEAKLEEQKPKMALVRAIESGKRSILVGDMAKMLCKLGVKTGETRFFEYLRQNGFLCRNGERRNHPTQLSIEMGVMEVKLGSYLRNGRWETSFTPMVTVKGQQYFVNRLVKEQMIETMDV